MDTKIDNTFTVQGRDTPVLVGAVGERAGHPRPSSSDCSEVPVGDQAGTSTKDTGANRTEMTEAWIEKLLKKKPVPKLAMKGSSPGRPYSAPCSPTNISILDLTWSEEEARSLKRKRVEGLAGRQEPMSNGEASKGEEEQTSEERLGTMIRRNLSQISGNIQNLAKLARERNTKKEIKDIAAQLKSLISQISTDEASGLLQKLGNKSGSYHQNTEARREEIEPANEGILEKKDEEIRALKRELEEIKEELKEVKLRRRIVTEEQLQEASYENYSTLEDMEWPENMYKAAFIEEGSPLRESKNSDLLVLKEEERWQRVNEGCRRIHFERFPELTELEGGLAALTVRTGILGSDGTQNVRERWVIRAEVGGTKEDWFKKLKELKEMLSKGQRTKIAMYPPGQDTSGEVTRKMLEIIFRDSNIKCTVFVRRYEPTEVNKGEDPEPRQRRPRPDAFILQKEGKSYADLLKEVKDKVKPGTGAAKGIRTIRQTRDGNMLVVLEAKDAGSENELRRELEKIQSLKIKRGIGEGEETLFLSDIDGVTTREEVIQVVCQETGLGKEQVKVGDMKEAFGSNQRATLTLPKEKAIELIRRGGIRIGLSWCTIKERVEVARCYRCWKYGHYGRECKEQTDSSKLCRRCGGTGHLAKECKGEERCLTCKEQGHVAGSGRCPEFRKALARERRKAEKKRAF